MSPGGETSGTLVEVMQVLGPEGMVLRRDDPSAGILSSAYRLIAAICNVFESVQSED